MYDIYSFYANHVMTVYEYRTNPKGETYMYCTYEIRGGNIYFSRDSIILADDTRMYWSNALEAWVGDSVYVKNSPTDTIEFTILKQDSMEFNVIDHMYGSDHGGEYILKRLGITPYLPPRVL